MLKVRQEMVEAAFEAAFEETLKLPVDEYGRLIKSFILESVREGEGEFYSMRPTGQGWASIC